MPSDREELNLMWMGGSLFLGLIARTYYGIVGVAMRQHDPRHMVFGEKYLLGDIPPQVVKAAIPHIDEFTVGGQWSTRQDDVRPAGGVVHQRIASPPFHLRFHRSPGLAELASRIRLRQPRSIGRQAARDDRSATGVIPNELSIRY